MFVHTDNFVSGWSFVTGDFNSRTADGPDFLLRDYYINVDMNENLRDNEIPLRKSRDLVIDNYGRRLLDLCKSTDLLIANGRLGDDKDTGEFTCVTNRGRSVVDYLLLPLQTFDYVSHFSICDVDEHSDHSALYFCLTLCENNINQNRIQNASTCTSEKKLIWTCKNQDQFKRTLLNEYTKYDEIITKMESDILSINEGVKNFSKSLFDDSFRYFGKTLIFESEHHSKPSQTSNPWFDNTCKTAKQNFNRAKHAYSRCRSDQNRVTLTQCRTSLNKAKRRAQATYKFVYPACWSEGVITPIHKKGSLDETNNYRGITLINTLSKIYSHILNNRLLNWASEQNKISEFQFGFQKNKSTVDCIFLFHSIISKILDKKEKLYCCFIDYQKAFDSVNRSFLWQKLLRNGCSKIMLKALYAMYQSVKSCVRYKGNHTLTLLNKLNINLR